MNKARGKAQDPQFSALTLSLILGPQSARSDEGLLSENVFDIITVITIICRVYGILPRHHYAINMLLVRSFKHKILFLNVIEADWPQARHQNLSYTVSPLFFSIGIKTCNPCCNCSCWHSDTTGFKRDLQLILSVVTWVTSPSENPSKADFVPCLSFGLLLLTTMNVHN